MLFFMIYAAISFGFGNDLSLAFGYRHSYLTAKDDRFDAKVQPGFSLNTTFAYNWHTGDGMAIDFGLHQVKDSNIDRGYSYRGFRGLDGAILYQHKWKSLIDSDLVYFLPGIQLGPGVFISTYNLSNQLFFYPGIILSFFGEINPVNSLRFVSSRILLPVEIYFRKDLSHAISFGIGVETSVAYRFEERTTDK
jgi:hypothetical protein